jgi:hypothetical protein
MDLQEKITIPPEVMARQVGEETVILHLTSGNYFGLNAVGARIWQLISQGMPRAAICEALLLDYDVAREDLERDIERLIQDLLSQGLINNA